MTEDKPNVSPESGVPWKPHEMRVHRQVARDYPVEASLRGLPGDHVRRWVATVDSLDVIVKLAISVCEARAEGLPYEGRLDKLHEALVRKYTLGTGSKETAMSEDEQGGSNHGTRESVSRGVANESPSETETGSGGEPAHLMANKRHGAHAACDRELTAHLVETVGEVTCEACKEVLRNLYQHSRPTTDPKADEMLAAVNSAVADVLGVK